MAQSRLEVKRARAAELCMHPLPFLKRAASSIRAMLVFFTSPLRGPPFNSEERQ